MQGTCTESAHLIHGQRSEQKEHKLSANIGKLSNKSSAVAEMGDRLTTIDMGQKVEVLCPFSVGEAKAKAYLRAKWHLDPPNRLTTINQRYRQTEQQSRSIGRTVTSTCNGRPKTS